MTFFLLKIGHGTEAKISCTGNPVTFSTSQDMSWDFIFFGLAYG